MNEGIVVDRLSVTFDGPGTGDVEAVSSVDLSVPQGAVIALLGPNGAGKTTIVRAIATLIRPTSGSVRVDGVDVVAQPHRARSRIGLSGQFATVDENLSGVENLIMVARLSGFTRVAARSRAEEMLERFGVASASNRRVATWSGGMRRRLDLAGALVARPPVVVLDEPSAGLDPQGRQELWGHVADLAGAGSAVLLTTQYLEEADRLADDVTLIHHGAVVARGTPGALKRQFGTSIVTVTPAVPTDVGRAVELLSGLGYAAASGESAPVQSSPGESDPGQSTPGELSLTVAAVDGDQAVARVVSAMAIAGIEVAAASVRIPTLDDAFLRLTNDGR